MGKKKKTEARQWHPAFFAGLQIELEEEKGNLIFENERQLSKKPLGIDILVVKVDGGIPVRKNIGRIFRKYNIIEYKGPADYLSIDDFYKVFGYACLYKADTGGVDAVKFQDITITFFCHKYPGKLVKHLRKSCHYEVEQCEEGIYQVKGERIPIQIILTKKLSEERNLWLRYLGNPVRDTGTARKLAAEYKGKQKDSRYEAAMDMIIKTNAGIFKEANGMGKALEEFAKEILAEELEARERKGKAEGKVEGKAEGKAENILDLLEDYGEIPKELRKRIMSEQDLDVLRRWIKLAARAASVEEFQMAM